MYRIGIGLDSHRIKFRIQNSELKIKKTLILGGVEISKDYYSCADSDGDVIIHSLCNALSTAIGEGSLDTWAGPMAKIGITDSKEFLKVIMNKVTDKGYKISNISIMLEGQQPRLERFREKISQSLAKLLAIDSQAIGMAFTTGEDLTPFGKGEGIQVFTQVLLSK